MDRKLDNEISRMFFESLLRKKEHIMIISGARRDTYYFNYYKIKEYEKRLLEIALSIVDFDKGIYFEQVNRLESGEIWTEMRQHIGFLLSLLDAANMIEYLDNQRDYNPKVKLLEQYHKKRTSI